MKIPFGDAFVLLLYLLPGFLAMQLYRASYPAKRISQFEIVVWSVLHSFVVHLGITGLARGLGRPDLDFLHQGSSSEIESKTIAVLLGGGFAWGCLLIAFHWLRIKVRIIPSPIPRPYGRWWPVEFLRMSSGRSFERSKDRFIWAGSKSTPSTPRQRITSSSSAPRISWTRISR